MFAKIRSVIFFGLVICHGLLKSEDLINKITSFSNQDGVVENNASVYSNAVLAKIAQNFKQESDPINYQDKQVSKKDLILLSTLEWLDNIESLKNKNDQSLVNTLVTPVEFYQGRLKEHLESMAKAMGSGRDDVARIEEEASSLFFESDGTLKIKATRATKSAELFSEIKSAVTNELRNKFERGGFFAFLAKIFPFLKNKPSFSQVLDKISKSPDLNVVGDTTGAPRRIRENLIKNKIPEVKNIEESAKASQPAASNTPENQKTQTNTDPAEQPETPKASLAPRVPLLKLPNKSDVDPVDKPTQQEQVDPTPVLEADDPAESPRSSRSGSIVSTVYSDDREPGTPVSTDRSDTTTGQDLLRSNEAEGKRLTRSNSAPARLSTKDSVATPKPPVPSARSAIVDQEQSGGISRQNSFALTTSGSSATSSRRGSTASSQGFVDDNENVLPVDENPLSRISSSASLVRTNSSLSMKSGGFEDDLQFSDEEVKALQLDGIAQQLKNLEDGINEQGLIDELLTKNAQLIQTVDGLRNDEEFLKNLTVSEKAYLGHLDLQVKNISNLNLLKIMEEDAAKASKDKKSFAARQESFVSLSKKVGIEVSEELFKKMAVEIASPDNAGFALGSKQSVSNDFVAHLKSMIVDTQRNFLANEFIVQKFGDASATQVSSDREKFVAAFDKALEGADSEPAKQKKLNKLQGAVVISMQSLPAYADFDALNKNISTASAGMQNDLGLHTNLVGYPGWEELKYKPNNLRSTPAQNKKTKVNLDADDQLQEEVLKHIFKASGMEYVVDLSQDAEARISKNRMTVDALRIDLDSPQWLQLQKQISGKDDAGKAAIFDDFLIGGKLDLKSFGETKFSQKFVKYFNDSEVDPSTIPSFNPQAKANISIARAKLRTALLGYELADQIPTDAARHKAGSALMNLSGKEGWMLDLEQEKALNAFIDQVTSSGVDIYDQQVAEDAVNQKMFDKLSSLEVDETVKAFVDGAQSYSEQKLKDQLKRDLYNSYATSSDKPFWFNNQDFKELNDSIFSVGSYQGAQIPAGTAAPEKYEDIKFSEDAGEPDKSIKNQLDKAVNKILDNSDLKEKIFKNYTESKAINAVQIGDKTIDFEDFKAYFESKPEDLLKLSKKIGSVEPSVVDLVKAAVQKTVIPVEQKIKFTAGLASLSAALEAKDKSRVLDFVHKDCFDVQLDHVARKVAKLTFAGASTTSLATFNSEPFKKYLNRIKLTLSADVSSNKNQDSDGAEGVGAISDELRFQRLAQLNEIADQSLRSEKKGTDYFLGKIIPRDKQSGLFEVKLSFAEGLNKILELEVADRDRLDILDLQKKEKVRPLIQTQRDAPGDFAYPPVNLREEAGNHEKTKESSPGTIDLLNRRVSVELDNKKRDRSDSIDGLAGAGSAENKLKGDKADLEPLSRKGSSNSLSGAGLPVKASAAFKRF